MLTGLGGPARLYQAIGHIGTRPLYETPGAILPKTDSFGCAKRLPGTIMCRSLRGLRIRPRPVLLLAFITDILRGARDGDTARVPYWTPYPWWRYRTNCSGEDTSRYCSHAYQTHCPGRRHDEVLRAYLPNSVLIVTRPPPRPRAVILLSCIPHTLSRMAIVTIPISRIPGTLLWMAILREYTRDTLPRAVIPDELPRAAIHIETAHVHTRRTAPGGNTACRL